MLPPLLTEVSLQIIKFQNISKNHTKSILTLVIVRHRKANTNASFVADFRNFQKCLGLFQPFIQTRVSQNIHSNEVVFDSCSNLLSGKRRDFSLILSHARILFALTDFSSKPSMFESRVCLKKLPEVVLRRIGWANK